MRSTTSIGLVLALFVTVGCEGGDGSTLPVIPPSGGGGSVGGSASGLTPTGALTLPETLTSTAAVTSDGFGDAIRRDPANKTIIVSDSILGLSGRLTHDTRTISIGRGFAGGEIFASDGFDRGIRLTDSVGRVLDMRAEAPGTTYDPNLYDYAFLGTIVYRDGGETIAADGVWGIRTEGSLMPTSGGTATFFGYADGATDLSDVPFDTFPARPGRDFIMANGIVEANVDFGSGDIRIDITDMELFDPDTGDRLPVFGLVPEGFQLDARFTDGDIFGNSIAIIDGNGDVQPLTGADAVNLVDGSFYGYDGTLVGGGGGPDELGGVATSIGSDGKIWLRFIAD